MKKDIEGFNKKNYQKILLYTHKVNSFHHFESS